MSPFDLLVVMHLVFDVIFQRSKTAYNKLTDKFVRACHCMIYGFAMTFGCILLFPTLSILGYNLLLLYFTLTHYIVDTPSVKAWIQMHTRKEENCPLWYYLMLDQILHVVTLVPIALMFGLLVRIKMTLNV